MSISFKLMSKIIAVSLFVILMIFGTLLSQRKELWNDEFYTQHNSIDAHSYGDILTSKIVEGNLSPLFYLGQKLVADCVGYTLPMDRSKGYTKIHDPALQVWMRVPSNICMSSALALMLYLLMTRFNMLAFCFGLVSILSTPMVWLYWVEARLYALWFCLTVIQLFLLIKFIENKNDQRVFSMMVVTHVLLAFSTIGSIFQLLIATGLIAYHLRTQIKRLWLLLVPLVIVAFYIKFFPGFKFKTFFFWSNLFEALLPERFCVILLFVAIWCYRRVCLNFIEKYLSVIMWMYFLLVAFSCLLLATHLNEPNWQFGFFGRYLIFLVPVEIILFAVAIAKLVQWSKGIVLLQLNIILVGCSLVILRGIITYHMLLSRATFLGQP